MSLSPPSRRLSSTNSSSKESLINAYEAEEERIINILSRKLEKLREEKIELENALEAESESHVNRLSREISALRLAQQQTLNLAGSTPGSPVDFRGPFLANSSLHPDTETLLDALRRENENLRSRLVETERDYVRVTRLNEVYREELIDHRRRLGLPVDNLIGLAPSSTDPFSQPLHLRGDSHNSSISSSPSLIPATTHNTQPHTVSARVPIPRPPSQIRRPHPNLNAPPSPSTTPPSSGSASLQSPSPFSPTNGMGISATTTFTTPPSSDSPRAGFAATVNPHELTYPSVPPPSLSSSFGDPLSPLNNPYIQPTTSSTSTVPPVALPAPVPIPRPIPRRYRRDSEDLDLSVSPTENFSASYSPLSPRASFHLARKASYERLTGSNTGVSVSPADGTGRGYGTGFVGRNASLERNGARVAETGRLVPRYGGGGGGNGNGGDAAGSSEPRVNGAHGKRNEQGPT
ncbi:hypothetical protein BXZ70DRAFT_1063712 [Cristinia sonorae]|uniref:Uncharacterized protein n=1 Tax=Cristinia sonorae TaxID=1940300 RepID=A0A8K0USH6_9AGAR|nr:hypothetical protein BXZ70DRAFT_1063712 [Cristinia sonorae]